MRDKVQESLNEIPEIAGDIFIGGPGKIIDEAFDQHTLRINQLEAHFSLLNDHLGSAHERECLIAQRLQELSASRPQETNIIREAFAQHSQEIHAVKMAQENRQGDPLRAAALPHRRAAADGRAAAAATVPRGRQQRRLCGGELMRREAARLAQQPKLR